MDERCYEILTEVEVKHPTMVSFDLTDDDTVTALRTLRAGGYIRLYMDGDAEITGEGLASLAAERSRREAAAAQGAAQSAAEAGSALLGIRACLGAVFAKVGRFLTIRS